MLTILLGWLGKMLSVNGRSHVIDHVMIIRIFGTPKSCAFGKTLKKCSIDSIMQVELS